MSNKTQKYVQRRDCLLVEAKTGQTVTEMSQSMLNGRVLKGNQSLFLAMGVSSSCEYL